MSNLTTSFRAWLSMARISNLPTITSNVLVGSTIAGAMFLNARIILLMVASAFFYTAGMFLNDIADLQFDKENRPERPLVRGAISKKAALCGTAILFIAGSVIFFYQSAQAFMASLLLILFIILYDYWHKKNLLSPLIMAACRIMVYIISFLAFIPILSLPIIIAGAGLGIYIILLTLIAKYSRNSMLVATLIAGISLYDALVLVLIGNYTGTIIALGAFILTLFLQRYIKGT